MAQLSEDCFAFGGQLLSLKQAQQSLIHAAKISLDEEFVALDHLPGRILSRQVTARLNVPPFTNSAVDGYAFAHGDGPAATVVGTLAAGAEPPRRALGKGQAMRVLTGAPISAGADTVVMDEDAAWNGEGHLRLPPQLKRGSNVRPLGEDMAADTPLYPAGGRVRALDLARLAAAGVAGAWAHRPMRIHVLSSGDEIHSGQVVDANRWLLATVFAGPAFDLHFGGSVRDDKAASINALKNIDADLIVTSGGVSVGERDFLRDAIEALGAIEFWRVGIKPGRPVAFGHAQQTPIFGLPGNPVACFITAQFLALPYALARMGSTWTPPIFTAPLGAAYRKKARRTEFVRIQLDGEGRAHPYPIAGAGIISSLTQADALAILDEDMTELPIGTPVPLIAMKGLAL